MKNLSTLFILFFSFISYSQPEIIEYNDKFKEFDYYAKPSENGDLTRYFERHINTDLLTVVKLNNKNDFQKRIFLTFKFKNNKVSGIKVNSKYSELNSVFTEAFKEYDIEKLNIKDKSPLNLYMIQLVSWENNKAILNCSQHVIIDKLPLFKGCESAVSYNEMRRCINKKLETHIAKNISPDEIKKAKVIGKLKLKPRFLINSKGEISRVNVKSKTSDLTKELNQVVASFPKPIRPAMRNGNLTGLFYNGSVKLLVDGKDENYEKDIIKSNEPLLNISATNDLALHFKKHLKDKELQNINIPIIQKSISVHFAIDKKGRAIEMKTSNYKNQSVNNRLVSIFKKFPLEKLKINSKDALEMYSFIILTKVNGKNMIACSNEARVNKFPVFKGCEKSKTPNSLKKCLSEKVGNKVKREFDTNLKSETKLTGMIRMYCIFKIDTNGAITDVRVRAPNPHLANEVEKVIKSLPKAVSPGYQNGKVVKVPYALPIIFNVGENKPVDPFKDMIKQR